MLFDEAKIILDLCGGTGAWSKPYKDAGYDVRVITLPEQDVIDYIPPKSVYGILAAPPCDQFSLARNYYENHPDYPPRDTVKGMNPVNACIRIIWQTNPKFWALENPVGILSNFMGKPYYIFEPWNFGDPWSKRTALWGSFDKPKAIYSRWEDVPDKEIKKFLGKEKNYKKKNKKIPSISEFTTGKEKELRATTPQGFAKAFFEANR